MININIVMMMGATPKSKDAWLSVTRNFPHPGDLDIPLSLSLGFHVKHAWALIPGLNPSF